MSLSPWVVNLAPMMTIYVGPDQVMPVMSVLATVMGFLMIFWNKVLGILRRIFGLSKGVEPAPPLSESKGTTPKEPPAQS